MGLLDILSGTELSEFISGYQNNPLWRQAQIQLQNQQRLADLANSAYNQQMGANAVPQQNVAAIDPYRMAGLMSQMNAANTQISPMYSNAANALSSYQGGSSAGQNALQNIASGTSGLQFNTGATNAFNSALQPALGMSQGMLGNIASGAMSGPQYNTGMSGAFNAAGAGGLQGSANTLNPFIGGNVSPTFGTQTAEDYSAFMQPQLLGAQQALQNQANMSWNKGVAGLADGGGFMSSGRNAALGQAMENAATALGANQQQLAYNAATQAAQAGQQSGMAGYAGQLNAAGQLAGQQYGLGLEGARAGQQGGLAQYQGGLGAAEQLSNQFFQGGMSGAALGGQYGLQDLSNRLAAGQALGQQGLGALGLTNNIAQGYLMPGQIQEAAGATLQGQRQNELNAQYQNQMNQFLNPFRALQNYQAGLGVLGSSNYAPDINPATNAMALIQLLGYNPSQLMQGGGNALMDMLGPAFSGLGGLFRDAIGSIFSGGGSSGSGGNESTSNSVPNPPRLPTQSEWNRPTAGQTAPSSFDPDD